MYQLFVFEIGNWSDTSRGNHVAWQETSEEPPDGVNSTNSSWILLSNGHWATRLANTEEWEKTVCLIWDSQSRHGKMRLDTLHFAGSQKPWRNSVTSEMIPTVLEDPTIASQRDIWFYWLGVGNRTWDLRLPSFLAHGGKLTKKNRKHGTPMQYDGGKNKNVLLLPNVEIPRSFLEDISLQQQ